MVDLYSEAATFGIISANIRLIIMIVISIILIIIGISIIVQPVKRSKMAKGTITSSNCSEHTIQDGSKQSRYYDCIVNVKCNIDGKDVVANLTITTLVPYKVNQIIDLYYDPNDVTNIDIFSDNYRFWGWLIIIVAIFMVLGTAIWAYIVHKSKFAAAIGGGAEGIGLLGNALGGLFGRR
jgi:hypothetical protein